MLHEINLKLINSHVITLRSKLKIRIKFEVRCTSYCYAYSYFLLENSSELQLHSFEFYLRIFPLEP